MRPRYQFISYKVFDFVPNGNLIFIEFDKLKEYIGSDGLRDKIGFSIDGRKESIEFRFSHGKVTRPVTANDNTINFPTIWIYKSNKYKNLELQVYKIPDEFDCPVHPSNEFKQWRNQNHV